VRRIFGPKKEEEARGWRRLHNEKVHASPDVIRVIISNRMRWEVYVAHGVDEKFIKIWSEILKGRHNSVDLGVDWSG